MAACALSSATLLLSVFYALTIFRTTRGEIEISRRHVDNFLNQMKADLQMNNDDYVEARRLASNPYLSPSHTARDGRRALNNSQPNQNAVPNDPYPPKYPPKLVENTPRKGSYPTPYSRNVNVNYTGLPSQNVVTKLSTAKPATPNPLPPFRRKGIYPKRRLSRPRNKYKRRGPNTAQSPPIRSDNSVIRTDNQMEKKKKFLDKNLDLLKGFMNKRSSTPAISLEDPAMLKLLRQGETNDVQRLLMSIPHDHMLDLVPAKGGRLHGLRMKGRLCQRHVLFPEGPKYDSKGKMYLSEHNRHVAHGRAYNVTMKPRFMLPVCCNCCRKSVLGCE